jgi:hypothetical protein
MSTQYAFAPYQDPPEDIPVHEREHAAFASATHYSSEEATAPVQQGEAFLASAEGGDDRINQYETSLPLRLALLGLWLMCRLDVEAAAAYVFPPVTGVALLMLEHHNSYVRFHAWQVSSSVESLSDLQSAVLFSGFIVLTMAQFV